MQKPNSHAKTTRTLMQRLVNLKNALQPWGKKSNFD